MRRFAVSMVAAGMLGPGWGAAPALSYPTKPIRIVTAEAGAAGDFATRVLAQALSGTLGQNVIVDNRPSGAIPCDVVAKAPPDGYTLLHFTNSTWTLPLMQRAPYDPVRDFAPISLTVKSLSVLVVHPSLPIKSVPELIAYAKARPGALNYGSGGTGGAGHLSAELFKSMAEVDIVRVHYKGGGPALNALLGNQVQLGFLSAPSVMPHVKSGRLRALAVSGPQPSSLFPDVPTVAASGIPGYEVEQLMGVFAPAKIPASLVALLNREIVQVLGRADVKERYHNASMEVVGSSPAELALAMKADMARMGKLIKVAGIRAD
ncbi:MAG TPA: tripartite tricarboxylate transporter substrate-binding protein [Burkholderiales bacterium]|nr:tripartite tricarboxylate transporter substrate-binding protein [Burkholderiales bacterium]